MSQSPINPVFEPDLPRSWEEEDTFGDVLYEWMNTAPWLLISGLLHVVAAFILAAIPWSDRSDEKPKVIEAAPPPPPLEVPEEEPEDPPEFEEPEVTEILDDVEVAEVDQVDTDSDQESTEGVQGISTSSFDSPSTNSALGSGGPPGGGPPGRGGGNKNTRKGGRKDAAIADGLKWLHDHQDEDGSWDCDNFFKHDPGGAASYDWGAGDGDSTHDVGITALALLAFMGDGHTMNEGKYSETVSLGVKWLLERIDPSTGLVGDRLAHAFLYDHAIATLALCEAVNLGAPSSVKRKTKKAVEFIGYARNDYRVWRYAAPGNNENDTSVTGWMVFALKSAKDAGINVDKGSFKDSITWFDDMTDEGTGRVGYQDKGSLSSRVDGTNENFPRESGEAMTSVALLCRFFLGQNPDEDDVMKKHADLLLKALPKWSDSGLTNDMYYWYYGSYAMFQMDGKYWKAWEAAMKPAMVDTQLKDGAGKGSWDPNGPWGWSGGRVYSTAIMVLCLESYYRYSKVLGGR